MPQQITNMLGNIGSAIREFTVAQRTLALIGLAVLALAVVGLTAWMAKPSYAPLFTGLSAADASAIVEQLDAEGVAYQLTEGGSSILVAQDNVYRMRLSAASAGLPSSGDAGYALLDDMGMSSSEFQQGVTYKRAMEGELGKTIGAVDGVRTASVQLALPEQTVFVSEKVDPTASVFVDVAPGRPITDDQVQAIVHLVAASIEGMKPNNVAVIDSSGTVLSAVGTGLAGASGGTGKQTNEYQDRIGASVQAMLDRVVGPGNAVVSVTADLDFDERQSTSQTFTATEGILPHSSTSTMEKFTGAGGTAGGVLGPDNIAVPGGANKGDGKYSNESKTDNNAINQVTEVMTAAPGTLRRQSIAVVLNQNNAGALNMADVQAMVAAAAGVDAERGDTITVNRMAFDATGADAAQSALEEARAAEAAARKDQLIRTGVIAGVALLLLIVIAVIAARSSRDRRADREALDIGNLNVLEIDSAALALDLLESAQAPLALEPAEDRFNPVALEAERQRADIMALADEDPEQVADMLNSWISPGMKS